MDKTRRRFSKEFKLKLLSELASGKSVPYLSREYEIHPGQINKWNSELKKYGEKAFGGNGKLFKDESKMAELERKVGQLTMENDLLKKAIMNLKYDK